jgi:hypothetical protein
VQLKYEITFPEFREMAWLRHHSSIRWIIGICVGIGGLMLGLVFFVYADHWLGIFFDCFVRFLTPAATGNSITGVCPGLSA